MQDEQLYFCSVPGIHNQYHFLLYWYTNHFHFIGHSDSPQRSSNCSSTLTNFVKNFNFFCTDLFLVGIQLLHLN